MKIHGGAIGILDNPNSLLRWAVSAPIIAEMCRDCDSSSEQLPHHEDTRSFEIKFRKDVDSLYTAINDLGNPFKEKEKNLVQLASRVVLSTEESSSSRKAHTIGEEQFKKFL